MTLESVNTNEQFLGDNWVLPTDIDLVEPAEDAFVSRLEKAGWNDPDTIFDLRLAFKEALINAISHGNLGVTMPEDATKTFVELVKEEQMKNPTDKKVHVDIKIDENRVSVTIRDEGKGFNWRGVADPREDEALLKPKGRGVMLMRTSVDSITYNEEGNEVTMVKSK